MSRQDQSVAEGASAFQATGNITVNYQGLSPSQMLEIMDAVAGKIAKYAAEAEDTFRERLNEFHDKVLEEFARDGTAANSAAFQDPDYQFVLREAQNAYGRSGDEGLREELVRLLAERSAENQRSRKALILNEAIGVVGSLTKQEFSALAMLFFFKHCRVGSQNRSDLYVVLEQIVGEFIEDLPSGNFSYEYLESMRCVAINQISHSEIWAPLHANYGMLFSSGFSKDQLQSAAASHGDVSKLLALTVAEETDYNGKVKFAPALSSDLEQKIADAGFDPDGVAAVMAVHNAALLSADKIKEAVLANAPSMAALDKVWASSSLRTANLTALGKVVAHSALTSRTEFQAPLEIWVQ